MQEKKLSFLNFSTLLISYEAFLLQDFEAFHPFKLKKKIEYDIYYLYIWLPNSLESRNKSKIFE